MKDLEKAQLAERLRSQFFIDYMACACGSIVTRWRGTDVFNVVLLIGGSVLNNLDARFDAVISIPMKLFPLALIDFRCISKVAASISG